MKKKNDDISYLRSLISDLEDEFDDVVLSHDYDNCSIEEEIIFNSYLKNLKLRIDEIKKKIKDVEK